MFHAPAAAMDQLTKNLTCEWAADGIRVNSIKVVSRRFHACDLGNLQQKHAQQAEVNMCSVLCSPGT